MDAENERQPSPREHGVDRGILAELDAVVFATDGVGRWTYLSPAWERLTGRRAGDCLGEPFVESLVPEERDRTVALVRAVVAGNAAHCHHRTRLRTGPGRTQPAWVDLFAQPVRGPDGVVLRSVGVLLDVADEVTGLDEPRGLAAMTDRQHHAVAELARTALEAASVAQVLDRATELVAVTLGVPYTVVLERDGERTLTTRSSRGWPVSPPNALWSVSVDDGDLLGRALQAVSPVVVPAVSAERTLARHRALRTALGGSAVWVPVHSRGGAYGLLGILTTAPRRFRPDETAFLGAVAQLLTSAIARLEAEDRIRSQALHDELTGLANRTLLQDRLEHALARRRRSGGRVALVVMDLDRFKDVNDTLGHAAGDDVLRTTASRLEGATRASDTVARLGGDEFAVVLTDVGDAAAAVTAAEHLRRAVSEPLVAGGVAVRVEGSAGIALAPDHGDAPGDLLRRADAAMYRAKHTATGVWVHTGVDAPAPERLGRHSALREALESGQLRVRYQPQVRLRDGCIERREALVRWDHPSEGLILPGEFLPLAERTGLIEQLTDHVLTTALEDMRRWRERGLQGAVAVNLSLRGLHSPTLFPTVMRRVEAAGLPPSELSLEVSQSAVMAQPESAVDALRRYRDVGVRLSIDDFGAGPSVLEVLHRLPVHALNVSAALVRRLDESPDGAAVLGSLVDLAHGLGLGVLAKGVETTTSCVRLAALGCDAAEGFLLGRPEPIETLLADP